MKVNIRILPYLTRFNIYQEERFPLRQYLPLVAAFSFSGLAVSYMVAGASAAAVTPHMFLVAFGVSILLFAQLRICDEFKDRETDALLHPERPVPRGLVSLSELRTLGIVFAGLQITLALSLSAALLVPLLLCYLYMTLMTFEFFCPRFLKAHPALYMVSHMLVLFFTDFFITSCHWLVAGTAPPSSLLYFFATSFMLGIVIEVGRKIRGTEEERAGVETYSSLWGPGGAMTVWLGAVSAATGFALKTASLTGHTLVTAAVMAPVLLFSARSALVYLDRRTCRSARSIETASGVFTLMTYLAVGFIPCLLSIITTTIEGAL